VDLTIPIWNDKTVITDITDKINVIYKEIKVNEFSPKVNDLLHKVEKSNADKTKEKLNIMNTLQTI
jgi:uncharacterized protein (UPF0335 family)